MKLYFVSPDTIAYKDDKGALIDFTKEAAQAALGQEFGNKEKNDLIQLLSSEADANEWAMYSIDPKSGKQHAVATVELEITEEEFKKLPKVTIKDNMATIRDAQGAVIKTLDQVLVDAKNLKLISVSFKHADKAAKDVVFVEQPVAKTDAAKTSSLLATLKGLVLPLSVVGTVGAGFWYGNGVPAALSFAAKLIPAAAAIPAASLAVQIAVSAAVGLLAYGAFLAGQAAVSGISSYWKKINRTSKEKYADELAAEVANVKGLETKLELKAESSFVVKLDEMFKAAPAAAFDDKTGAFAKDEPKAGNQLSVIKWQAEKLKAYVEAKTEDRPALKTEIYAGPQAPKPAPTK